MEEFWTKQRRDLALAEAIRWKGVKHIDRIALPGKGIDCINYVNEILIASGVIDRQKLGTYDPTLGQIRPVSHIRDNLLKCLHCVSLKFTKELEMKFGDIVLTTTGEESAHCAFYDGSHIWHAVATKCVIRSARNHWEHKTESIVRIYAEGWRELPNL